MCQFTLYGILLERLTLFLDATVRFSCQPQGYHTAYISWDPQQNINVEATHLALKYDLTDYDNGQLLVWSYYIFLI